MAGWVCAFSSSECTRVDFRLRIGDRLAMTRSSGCQSWVVCAALVLGVLTSAACNSSGQNNGAPVGTQTAVVAVPSAQTTSTVAAGASPGGAAASNSSNAAAPTPAASAPSTAPGTTPPLTRDKLPEATILESKKQEGEGERLFDAKDFAGSLPHFEKALVTDPGNVNARYEFARSLLNAGKADAALQLLQGLRDNGCPLCLERVLNVAKDEHFTALQKDPRYLALAKSIEVKFLKLDNAGKRIVSWFMNSEKPTLPAEELLDPRATIVLDDQSKGAAQRFRQLNGDEALRQFMRKQFPKGVYPGVLDRCENSCCTVKNSDILGVRLKRFCFKMYGAAAVHLFKFEVEGDPAASFPG
jgi:hypothetical protein